MPGQIQTMVLRSFQRNLTAREKSSNQWVALNTSRWLSKLRYRQCLRRRQLFQRLEVCPETSDSIILGEAAPWKSAAATSDSDDVVTTSPTSIPAATDSVDLDFFHQRPGINGPLTANPQQGPQSYTIDINSLPLLRTIPFSPPSTTTLPLPVLLPPATRAEKNELTIRKIILVGTLFAAIITLLVMKEVDSQEWSTAFTAAAWVLAAGKLLETIVKVLFEKWRRHW